MKKIFILALGFLFIVGTGSAQDIKKTLKKASKSLSKYKQNPSSNGEKLDEALSLLDEAFAMEGADSNFKAWTTKAKIYNEIADGEVKRKIIEGDSYKLVHTDAAMTAFNSYKKAIAVAGKKDKLKDVYKGLRETERHLDNTAVFLYNDKDYAGSHHNFAAVLETSDILKANKKESLIIDDKMMNDKIYSTAVTGYYSGDEEIKKSSGMFFQKLYAGGSDEALVYEALFNLNNDVKYLMEGREKFPADKGMLFALINDYLQKDDLAGAESALKEAIVADPDNVTVYVTTGSVYERLAASEMEKGSMEKGQEYSDLAFDYYSQGLAKDASNYEANYSVGAMYYNQAALMTPEINKYSDDLSKAGTDKYNAAKAKMISLFDTALPYFLKAESINGSDLNTLVALKEIYAKKNDLAKSKEYKDKIAANK